MQGCGAVATGCGKYQEISRDNGATADRCHACGTCNLENRGKEGAAGGNQTRAGEIKYDIWVCYKMKV